MKKYIQLVYTFWSKIYDSLIDPLFHFDRKKVIKAIKIKNGDKILEMGVGTGLNLKYYPKDCTVYGIDFSKAMLKKAGQKKARAKIILKYADARKTSFPKAFFDKAMMTYVLRVSPSPRAVLEEAARVLKPKGTLVILDQFKGGNVLTLTIMKPFKLLLGWGKEYELEELVKGLPFKIKEKKKFGVMKNTQLVILQKK